MSWYARKRSPPVGGNGWISAKKQAFVNDACLGGCGNFLVLGMIVRKQVGDRRPTSDNE
ncbi:hypothetical protein [Nostoc sp. PCC 7524]|uniref:hypothetical protein n=1 Tax=Nostoc sp. (strain ATCC 29411 / PCC 7524) TaxID=28072 RepID=UPI001494A275|nr:hypothetical protein [Nostoc sp. PCC 7524]